MSRGPEGVPEIDMLLGMLCYATGSKGIGGRLRVDPKDFIVRERLLDGSIANESFEGGQPLGSGHFLRCVLVKENVDHFSAIGIAAEAMGCRPKDVGFAGMKDKRALTAQFVTFPVSKIRAGWNRARAIGGIKLIQERFVEEGLHPGGSAGNLFEIRVKGAQSDPASLRGALAEMGALGGAPNFYGYQRFGTVRPVTHIVGRLLVKGDLRGALMEFLARPFESEPPDAFMARMELYEGGDFARALSAYPKRLRLERIVLKALKRNPSDLLGAFRRLPHGLRKLFIEAYQSYLFNRVLSERMRMGLGLKSVEEGDLISPMAADGSPQGEPKPVRDPEAANADVSKGRACLVIPVFGYGVRLSEGAQGEIERRVLDEEGISPRAFYIGVMPEASCAGKYRRALMPIEGLILERVGNDLIFRFSLPRGGYATVVMREFIKPEDPAGQGF
ncbi:MAG: tRNA pseudouridine(13) synthase TruD [Candidatus Bathyarchaeia archaeon]